MTRTIFQRNVSNVSQSTAVDWSEVETKYTCVVCKDIITKPVLQLFCGHRLCGQCYNSHCQTSDKCPGSGPHCSQTDLLNDDHVLPDSPAERDLRKLEVHCPFREEGCQEILPLMEMKVHRQECPLKTDHSVNGEEQCAASGHSDELSSQLEVPQKSKSKSERFSKYLKRLTTPDAKENGAVAGSCSKINQNGVTIYKLPLIETHRDEHQRIRKVRTGTNLDSNQKTVLLVGATGCGKSTMIDGMVNYIYGVNWEDKHRVRLIDEDFNKSQVESQTEWITVYTISPSTFSNISYTLNIVDMPGFGDTRGIQRDKELFQAMRNLFSSGGDQGVDSVDAVCYVAKASDARLTPTQRYIFDSILSIFGVDIAQNIQILVSFVDGNVPYVLNVLKAASVPFHKSFKFNNACLFQAAQESQFDALFWQMGMHSYEAFFKTLPLMQPKSLILTSEVLKERDQINKIINDLQQKIQKAIMKISAHSTLEHQLHEVEKVIKLNENYEVEQLVTSKQKVHNDDGVNTTYCPVCDMECHQNCPVKETEDLRQCATIDKQGNCLVCPSHCIWSRHINRGFHYKEVIMEVKSTDEEMKQRYLNAKMKETEIKDSLKPLEKERTIKEQEVSNMVDQVTSCLRRLEQIALKKTQPTHIDYLNLLVEDENQRCEPGYEGRIQVYKDLIKKESILESVQSGTRLI